VHASGPLSVAIGGGLFSIAVILTACSTPSASRGTTSSPPPSSASTTTSSSAVAQPSSAVEAYLRLVEKGTEGSFSASYRVVSDGSPFGDGGGLVEVAQRSAPDRTPWPEGGGQSSVGKWSYRLTFDSGWDYQWIETGDEAADCWKSPNHPAWVCRGPGLIEPSNGFFIAVSPFLPGDMLQNIKAVADGGISDRANHLTIFTEPGKPELGPLTCLRDQAGDQTGTWCLTKSGFFADFIGSGNIDSITLSPVTLLTHASTAMPVDFQPAGRLRSGFELPGEG